MAIPRPGSALDRAALKRLADLIDLISGATTRLQEIERGLSGGPYRRRYLEARIREAQGIIERLMSVRSGQATGELVQWAREAFPETYGAAAVRSLEELGGQDLEPLKGAARIHGATVERLLGRFVDQSTEIVVQLQANVIRTSRVVLSQAGFSEEIAAGVIGGLPRREISRGLKRQLERAVRGALPDGTEVDLTHIEVGGRRTQLDVWAEQHARTELARASTGAVRTVSAANGVRHVLITTHAHAPCICTPFEGRIYSLDQGDPDFEWIGVVPNGGVPLHPNCVHREAPAVLEYMEERGEIEGRDTVPAAFLGLSDSELARTVRQNADRLDRYARSRTDIVPVDFSVRRAA